MFKKYFSLFLLILIIIIIFSISSLFGLFFSWRHILADKLFLNHKANENIVIVAIDNKSLEEVGQWPWDRKVNAELINKIAESNPAIIGVDINFSENSNYESDKLLEFAIRDAGNVVLPIEADIKKDGRKLTASNIIYPKKTFEMASFRQGLTNTPPDKDGKIRRIPYFIYSGEEKINSFFNVISLEFLKNRNNLIPDVLTDEQNQMIINYTGTTGNIQSLSAIDILNNKIDSNSLQNKIVLIGATAPDLHDEHLTPTSNNSLMSGVEIHANAINTVISNNFLTEANKKNEILILIIIILVITTLLVFLKTSIASLFVLFVLIIYPISAFIIFERQGIILDIFNPILAIFITYTSTLAWKYIMQTKEKSQIKKAFSRYVSIDVIEELLKNPKKLKLGGEEKELSILFSDIRGFTSISEKLPPKKLVGLLNKYLNEMTNIIMDSRGVVDKFIGDAIMAFWGAPLAQPKHAEKACETALNMINSLEDNRKSWQKSYGIELNIGIGINTGNVIIGNMGSDQRFDYTAMGDPVNLASRLEGITKKYGVNIIISKNTKEKAGKIFVYRFLDKVAVKGKKEGIKIYELICKKEELSHSEKKLIETFSYGIKLYQKRKWELAEKHFEKILNKYPDDGPTIVYLKRCRELKNNPPKEDWDGIYRLKSK